MKKLLTLLILSAPLAFNADAMLSPAAQFQEELNTIRAEVLAGTLGSHGTIRAKSLEGAIRETITNKEDETARWNAIIAFFNGGFSDEVVGAINALLAVPHRTQAQNDELNLLSELVGSTLKFEKWARLKLINRNVLAKARLAAEAQFTTESE